MADSSEPEEEYDEYSENDNEVDTEDEESHPQPLSQHSLDQEQRDLLHRWSNSSPPLVRPKWFPVHRPGSSMDGRYVTKFGGNKPFIPDNFTWPKCKEQKFKTFVCQINLATLPVEFQDTIKLSSGLLQIFICKDCDEDEVKIIAKTEFVPSLQSLSAEALVNHYELEDFDNSIEIRGQEVDIRDILPKPIREFVKKYMDAFYVPFDEEERVVDKWRLGMPELPWPYDGMIAYDGIHGKNEPVVEEIKRKHNLTANQFNLVKSKLRLTGLSEPAWGVKLGGWLAWRHEGFEGYPICPDCGVEMEVSFLQIMKSRVFNYYWGNNAEVQVTLCPKCQRPDFTVRGL